MAVRVIAPDGSVGSVPDEDLDAAMGEGYRLADPPPAPDPEPVTASPAPAPTVKQVRVIAPDGTAGSVPEDDLQSALDEGYSVPSEEEAAEAQLQATHGTFGQRVLAGAEALGRGLTFGATDYAERVGAGLAGAVGEIVGDEPALPRAAGPGLDAPLLHERPTPAFAVPGAAAIAQATGAFQRVGQAFSDAYGAAATEQAQDIEKRQLANPITARVGELTGAVAPAVLSGGSSAVADAARFTPVGALASLSARLGEAIAPKVATSVAGRIGLGTVLAAGEGAIDNAARQVFSDLTKGDVEITAERMMDAALEGAKWGGIFGAGGTALAEGVNAVASRAGRRAAQSADEAAPGHFDDAAQASEDMAAQGRPRAEIDADLDVAQQRLADADAAGNPQAVEEAERQLDSLLQEQEAATLRDAGAVPDTQIEVALKVAPPPEARGILDRLDAELNKAKNAREIGLKFDDVRDELTTSITQRVDDLQRYYQNDLGPWISRNNKPKAIRAALEREGVVWEPAQAERILRENEQALKYLNELESSYPLGDEVARRKLAPIKAAKVAIEGVQARLRGDVRGGVGPVLPQPKIMRSADLDTIADVFWAEDNLKSYLGMIAKKKGEVVTPAEAAIQKLYMRKRASLQDPRLWGKETAEMQTVTNAAQSKAIPAAQEYEKRFGRSSAERAGEHGFDVLKETEAHSVKGLVNDLANPAAYKEERDFVAGLQRAIEDAEARAKYYPMPDEVAAQLPAMRQQVQSIVDDLRTAKELALRKAAAERAVKEGSPLEQVISGLRALPWGASITGTIAGAARGVGAATVALTKGAIKSEQAVENAAKQTGKTFFRGADTAAEAARRPLSGLGITGNQVRKAVDDAQALQDPNSKQALALNAQIRELRNESPELAAALEQKVRARAEYILSKLGPQVDDSDPFQQGREAPMDRITEMRVARYVEAAQNIDKVLGRLAQGTASMEDVDAMRVLRPALFARYVAKVQAEVARAKEPPDPQARARLHMMLGVPFSREQQPANLARFARMGAQQQPQAQQQQAPQPKPGPKLGAAVRESFGARSDQILSERLDE